MSSFLLSNSQHTYNYQAEEDQEIKVSYHDINETIQSIQMTADNAQVVLQAPRRNILFIPFQDILNQKNGKKLKAKQFGEIGTQLDRNIQAFSCNPTESSRIATISD
jgi:hypothetical protein